MTYPLALILLVAVLVSPAPALSPTKVEKDLARQWMTGKFDGKQQPPFSFVYDGKPSSDLLKLWNPELKTKKLDSKRSQQTLTLTDPKTGLQVRCVSVSYSDYPVIEWTVYLKNTGKTDTPIISDIQGIDATVQTSPISDLVLNHNRGTIVTAADYEPFVSKLAMGQKLHFASRGGRPCANEFPYYDLSLGDCGVMLAIGWPGQWAADLVRESAASVRIRAGQELTNLKLQPGEEVRTPLIAMLFYQGDRDRSQNLWRRWMLAHNVPKPGGKPLKPQMPAVSGNQMPGLKCNEKDELLYLEGFRREKIDIDIWWMDAGWYPCGDSWPYTGTWEVDKERFPNGFKPIADDVHSHGKKLIVWFEPERCTPNTWITLNHPEWVLGGANGGLVNLGHPEAWKYIVENTDKIIVENGIDYYRQDFNMDPLDYWRKNDAPDRQGITENKHVVGYLAFWDELLKRHPNMLIDSCASGGHRNDLETLRRSVPLLRSDCIFDSIAEQCHTYGFSMWVPYWGTGYIDFSPYIVRSCMGPNMTLSMDARRTDLDWELLRRLVAQWRSVSDNFLGDFYTLTPYSLEKSSWMAWQYDRPEAGKGMVQAFRREECSGESINVRLKGLTKTAEYELVNLDDKASPWRVKGNELMDRGLDITISDKLGAAVITYRRADKSK